MKQRIELRQRQKQQFNTRFFSAMQILQMPNAELAQEVRDNLDANPLLEEVEFDSPEQASDFFSFPILSPSNASNTSLSAEQVRDYEALATHTPSIAEHLREQIRGSALAGAKRVIAEAIADSLDERGYLVDSLDELRRAIGLQVSDAVMAAALRAVQQFDPPGVAARSLSECLVNQLRFSRAAAHVVRHAECIANGWLQELAAFEYAQIAAALQIEMDDVRAAAALIQTLNPNPGSGFGESARAIVPDVIARHVEGQWRVGLNAEMLPRIGVSSAYREMIAKDRHSKSSQYLKKNLAGANLFIESLNRRHVTVLAVARELISRQRQFIERGDGQLRPLKIREISEQLELHESTVSRACAGKYILTPRGTIELKKFFSQRLKSDIGNDESARSVQFKVAQMVREEDPKNPLSDQQITDLLRDSGIQIARRTVAKYRLQMKIPSRNWRKAKATAQT